MQAADQDLPQFCGGERGVFDERHNGFVGLKIVLALKMKITWVAGFRCCLNFSELSRLVLLAVSRAPPIHTRMCLNECLYYNICSDAAPGNEEQLQVYKQIELPATALPS